MFKKFFRKVRDVAKKAAPIAGIAALGLGGASLIPGLMGGSGAAAGGGIGSMLKGLLGNFAKSAASGAVGPASAVPGSGILGLAQKGAGLAKNIGSSFINPDGTGTAMGGIASALLPAIGSYLAYKGDKPEPVDTNPMTAVDKRYGSRYGTGDYTDTLVEKMFFNPADGQYYDQITADGIYSNYTPDAEKGLKPLAMGGIVNLASGGNPHKNFPRKNGMINGPGGPKEDKIPAMLSDGEFVFTAKAVDNAGGPGAMYNMMNKLDPESNRSPKGMR
tara:strand:- start:512 stop:1336 length:825 start_codon:yes stop_codon:yes gene_type:complete